MRRWWDGDRRAVVTWLAGAALLAAAWLALAPTSVGGATTLVMVDGHSMEPLLYTGDLAVAMRKPSYAVGDLVVFTVGGGLVIHRLVQENADGTWRTQGDNKPSPDPWRISNEQIKGRFFIGLPSAGAKLRWVQHQPLFIGGIAAALTLALFVPWRRRGGAPAGVEPEPERGDAWLAIGMCGLGGAACLLLTLVLVRAGAPLTSAQPLVLGVAGAASVSLAIYLLTNLLEPNIHTVESA